MASPVTMVVGHTDNMTIAFLDQHGNPMLIPPVPDSMPTWTQTNPETATLTVAADGMSAAEVAVAPGTDVVTLTVTVGGSTFSAALPLTVSPEAQVLTSVDIVSNVV